MRLTIRTLLGYMDDILDPQDAEEIGRRIEESEVATMLYHRIRDVTRRLSLKAPDLEDEGDGLDPNTVAEYLDNVLPDDRVLDFEKVCLDSEMHLAEVAACHQILAVALGEAAEIATESREHMYQLPQVVADLDKLDQPPRDPFGLATDSNGGSPTNIPRRPTPVVPDYLREKSKRSPVVPIVVGIIGVVCVAVIILAFTDVLAPLGIGPGGEAGQEVAQNDQGVSGQPSDATPKDQVVSGVEDESNVEPSEKVTPDTALPKEQGEEKVSPTAVKPDALPETQSASEKTTVPEKTTPKTDQAVPEVGPSPSEKPAVAPSIPGVTGTLTPKPSASGGELGPTPVPALSGPSDSKGEDTPTEEAKPEETKTPALIGRFVSENHSLVQLDPADGSWKVVPQQGVLTTATPLVALPTFRPIIATASGLSVQLLSETQVTMQPTQEDAMPVLKLESGRIVLRSLGKSDLRLLLTAGDKTGIVTLVNPNSAAAVELLFHRQRGTDPTDVPSIMELNLFALSGTVLWEEDQKSEVVKVDASECIHFVAGKAKPKVEVLAELPTWIAVPQVSKLDQNAAEEILKALKGNNIASLALRELLDHRQREVSRLALKCLTQLGEFDTAVNGLDDPGQRLVWDQSLSQLFDLAGQSPEIATKVKQTFERVYGGSTEDLWPMFYGYTAQRLKDDGAIELIEYLSNDRLVFRVISFYNLKEITGKTLYYEPEETPARRRLPTQRWEKELQKGKIVPKGQE